MDRERTAADAMGRAGGASQLQALFREMDVEWVALLGRRASAEMGDWRESMAQMAKRHDGLVAGGKWVSGPPDMLGIVGKTRNEMVHTRLLAWLLDPRGKHRLGDAVLRRLLSHMASQEAAPCRCCATPREAPNPPVVRDVCVSHWRNGREADIVVFGRDFTLVIEVKVDASEQPKQCDDLYRNYGSEPGPWFLFLTPEGWPPRSATGCAKRAFKTASWKQVREMIEKENALRHRDASRADLGTAVPTEYAITLKEQFR